jgi:hypothetical protein
MRKTIGWMLAALFTLAALDAAAQAPNERFEAFLNGVAKDTDAAVDKLFRGSREEKISPKAPEQLKGRLKGTIPLLGRYSGFEKISEKELSPSLRRVVYLQKFESAPALWVVYLYKAGPNDWVINTMNYTVNLTDPIGAVLNGL